MMKIVTHSQPSQSFASYCCSAINAAVCYSSVSSRLSQSMQLLAEAIGSHYSYSWLAQPPETSRS